jgi:hypothetical protein
MPRFLVESYAAGSTAAFDDACERARRTASLGAGVTYVNTTFLPGDQTVLHLFEAPSAESVEAAGREAGLQFERIVQAIEDTERRSEGARHEDD